jgi:ABC-type multidrug transport system ATPase subunit
MSGDGQWSMQNRHCGPALLVGFDDAVRGRLTVCEGERIVLLGASGGGKTTLLETMLGLRRPVLQRRGSPLAALCAFVPQGDGVFLDATVVDNVRRPSHLLPEIRETDARDWLDLLALSAVADQPVAALSFRMRRRVALARALGQRKPLLVVDGELDGTVWPLLPTLLDFVPHLSSVLAASSKADVWAWRADSVALVDGGRVLAQDTMAQLARSADPLVGTSLACVTP